MSGTRNYLKKTEKKQHELRSTADVTVNIEICHALCRASQNFVVNAETTTFHLTDAAKIAANEGDTLTSI